MQPSKLDSSDVEGVQTQGGDPVHARRWWIFAVLGIAHHSDVALAITVVNIAPNPIVLAMNSPGRPGVRGYVVGWAVSRCGSATRRALFVSRIAGRVL